MLAVLRPTSALHAIDFSVYGRGALYPMKTTTSKRKRAAYTTTTTSTSTTITATQPRRRRKRVRRQQTVHTLSSPPLKIEYRQLHPLRCQLPDGELLLLSVSLLRDENIESALQKLRELLKTLLCSHGYKPTDAAALLAPELLRQNVCFGETVAVGYNTTTRVRDILNDGDFILFSSQHTQQHSIIGITLLQPPPSCVHREKEFYFDVKLHDFEKHDLHSVSKLWNRRHLWAQQQQQELDDYDYLDGNPDSDPFYYLPTHCCSTEDMYLLPPKSFTRMAHRKGFLTTESITTQQLASALADESLCLGKDAALQCHLYYSSDCSRVSEDHYSVNHVWLHKNVARVYICIHKAGRRAKNDIYIVVSNSGHRTQTAAIAHKRPLLPDIEKKTHRTRMKQQQYNFSVKK